MPPAFTKPTRGRILLSQYRTILTRSSTTSHKIPTASLTIQIFRSQNSSSSRSQREHPLYCFQVNAMLTIADRHPSIQQETTKLCTWNQIQIPSCFSLRLKNKKVGGIQSNISFNNLTNTNLYRYLFVIILQTESRAETIL